MKVRILFLTVLVGVCLLTNLSLRVPDKMVAQAQSTSSCPTAEMPTATVGSGGDVYFLTGQQAKLSLLNAGGDSSFFAAGYDTFGTDPVLVPLSKAGIVAKGLTISTPGAKATAVSCRDSFWDINFMLAGMGANGGDTIRLFMQADQAGNGAFNLATFVVASDGSGARLTQLEPTASLFGNGHIGLPVGSTLAFSQDGGKSGKRTEQITIALSMDKNSPTMKCLHLGIEIVRGSGAGSSAIVPNSIVLTREGPANGSGTGLFTGVAGNYPTAAACDRACPACTGCVRGVAPNVTIGASGDSFLLKTPTTFTLVNSSGEVSFFPTNYINFGWNEVPTAIAAAGQSALGLQVSGSGSSATALSCRDHFWDINFMLAGLGATAGDKIRLVMQQDDAGKGAFSLATFTVNADGNGVTLTQLEPTATLFANGHIAQNVGAILPYSLNAGAAGKHTAQITIALSMKKTAPTIGCQFLGIEVQRGSGSGTSTVVINTLVVVRDGATTATGTGIFSGQTGSYPTKPECDGACPSCCATASIPSVTVGSTGDVFLLKDWLKLTLLSDGNDASFFSTNISNFGWNLTLPRIADAGGSGQGIRISTPGSSAVAVSCRDSFWDLNFMLAGTGATAGDKIRLFMQSDQAGTGAFNVATFTVNASGTGAMLTQLEPTATLFGNGHVALSVGTLLPFTTNAGTSGKRTDQITIALSMDKNAPTMKCLHLGVEIARASGAGASTLVFNDIVLTREGPSNGSGTGLFSGAAGNYPTVMACDGACPACNK